MTGVQTCALPISDEPAKEITKEELNHLLKARLDKLAELQASGNDPDGVEKMSKSKGNYVGITEPANTMFAKVMSISDAMMWRYFTLLSFRPMSEIDALRAERPILS